MWCWLRQLLVSLLCRAGPVPYHVAIVMDGNRRFARQQCKEVDEGHKDGYRKLVEVLGWCLDLGIRCVSVYAFSTENFKRSREEVEALMRLAEAKYKEMLKESGLSNKYALQVRVLGDLSMAPEVLQEAAARAMVHSSKRKKINGMLNICFAYSSSHEIAAASDSIQKGLLDGKLLPEDVNEHLFESCLYTDGSPPIDLMIRTSGETRLSDFLLWQSRCAHIHFSDVLWPAFSYQHFAAAILEFQKCYDKMEGIRGAAMKEEGYGDDKRTNVDAGNSEDSGHRPFLATVLNAPLHAWAMSLHGLFSGISERVSKISMSQPACQTSKGRTNGRIENGRACRLNGLTYTEGGDLIVNGGEKQPRALPRQRQGTVGLDGFMEHKGALDTSESGSHEGVSKFSGRCPLQPQLDGSVHGFNEAGAQHTQCHTSQLKSSAVFHPLSDGEHMGTEFVPGVSDRVERFLRNRRLQTWKWLEEVARKADRTHQDAS